eukprot:7640558-Karenia_brevis.AAC.1
MAKVSPLAPGSRQCKRAKRCPSHRKRCLMMKDINARCTKEQLTVLEAGLDWVPMVLGDCQAVGSLVQKYYCETCKSMPITDGQWFLYRESNVAARYGSVHSAAASSVQ